MRDSAQKAGLTGSILQLTGTSGRAALRLAYRDGLGEIFYDRYDDFQNGKISADALVSALREFVETATEKAVESDKFWKEAPKGAIIPANLSSKLQWSITDKLKKQGVPDAEAKALAREIARDFTRSHSDDDIGTLDAAVDLAVSAISVTRRLSSAFASAAKQGEAMPRWVDRDAREFPTAERFLRHHYGPRLGANGDLTSASLGRLDPALLHVLNLEFRGERRAELHALLPTVQQRNDAKLLATLGYVPEGDERKNALTSISKGSVPRARR